MYNWNIIGQLLLSYEFHGRDISGIYFFNFASCESLKLRLCDFVPWYSIIFDDRVKFYISNYENPFESV